MGSREETKRAAELEGTGGPNAADDARALSLKTSLTHWAGSPLSLPLSPSTGEARLDALFRKAALFDSLREGAQGADPAAPEAGAFDFHTRRAPLRADLRAKVVAVEGDVSLPGLGLSEADTARITGPATRFFIHCAASISFFEHVHVLLSQNYVATRLVTQLARKCANLGAFIHVSTAYTNANLGREAHVEEAIYPLVLPDGRAVPHAATAEALLGMSQKAAAKAAAALVKGLGFPNAYTLSKHFSEDLVADLHARGDLNAAIVRPSVIGPVAGAPCPGYFGNGAGMTAAILSFASGMARFSCYDPDHVWDNIPCDTVVAATLGAAAAAVAAGARDPEAPLIVHAASSASHCERYGDLFRGHIFPYWVAAPPSRRFTKAPYKPVGHWTAFLPEHTLTFKCLKAAATIKFKCIATLLKLTGHPALAQQAWGGWQVYCLYNTTALDFHIFYCAARAGAVWDALPDAERDAFRMVWTKPDDWGVYMVRHSEVCRAKFFTAPPKGQAARNTGLEGVAGSSSEGASAATSEAAEAGGYALLRPAPARAVEAAAAAAARGLTAGGLALVAPPRAAVPAFRLLSAAEAAAAPLQGGAAAELTPAAALLAPMQDDSAAATPTGHSPSAGAAATTPKGAALDRPDSPLQAALSGGVKGGVGQGGTAEMLAVADAA